MSQKAKKEYVEAIRGRYQRGNRDEKGRILGEFCAICNLHRKHAIRVLNKAPKESRFVRMSFIQFLKELFYKARMISKKWILGDFSEPYPPGLWVQIHWCPLRKSRAAFGEIGSYLRSVCRIYRFKDQRSIELLQAIYRIFEINFYCFRLIQVRMNIMPVSDTNFEWTRKGGTLSDKTAQKEFGLTYGEISAAIKAGKLQYRVNSVFGNPFLRLLRQEVEALVIEKHGNNYFTDRKTKMELVSINRELKLIKAKMAELTVTSQ